jgi:acetyl-CoA C-acetyltransferase
MLRGRAAAVGLAERKPAREFPGETELGLFAKTAIDAIRDSGIPLDAVDGLCMAFMPGVIGAPSLLAETMGLRLSFAESVDLGGASGAGMIWRAAAAIANGMCETCVCITASMPYQPAPQTTTRVGRAIAAGGMGAGPHGEFMEPYGAIGVNFAYAMIARRYMHEFGITSEQMARVAVYQRDNAAANPLAFFQQKPISVDDVLGSPLIVEPLHLLDMVMPLGGAAAVVLTAAESAPGLPHSPAYLLGAGEHCTHWSIAEAPSLVTTGVKPAADRAFTMAGVARENIGLACVYDCYTHVVLLTLEDAGFCGKGEGGRFVDEHDFRWHGDFPVPAKAGWRAGCHTWWKRSVSCRAGPRAGSWTHSSSPTSTATAA